MTARKLSDHFVHLGLGATAVPQPPFNGMEWYEQYGSRHGDDGQEGRLVSQYTFSAGWDSCEMHPTGAEVVICTHGAMVLTQEAPNGSRQEVALEAGEYAINPPGVWHTADIPGSDAGVSATAIFITAGEGTVHRLR